MSIYRFGQWANDTRPGLLKWAGDKVYGAVTVFSPILTGVAIDRRTRVGKGFHIIHSGMILIHPDVVFGQRCGIMHNVTFGTNSRGGSGVPRIGDNVFVGPGAVLMGGISVGDGAVIGANSVVMTDVPPGALAIGVPAKIVPANVWQTTPETDRGSGLARNAAAASLQRQGADVTTRQRQ
jgi:serine O-acetyltransferase